MASREGNYVEGVAGRRALLARVGRRYDRAGVDRDTLADLVAAPNLLSWPRQVTRAIDEIEDGKETMRRTVREMTKTAEGIADAVEKRDRRIESLVFRERFWRIVSAGLLVVWMATIAYRGH